MDNSKKNPVTVDDIEFDRVDLDMDTKDEINRQMHLMTYGIDALDGLSMMLSHGMDDEIGITGDQVQGILKCVEYSLLTTQRNIIATLRNNGKGVH